MKSDAVPRGRRGGGPCPSIGVVPLASIASDAGVDLWAVSMIKEPLLEYPSLKADVPSEAHVWKPATSSFRKDPGGWHRQKLGGLLRCEEDLSAWLRSVIVDHLVNTSSRGPLGQRFEPFFRRGRES